MMGEVALVNFAEERRRCIQPQHRESFLLVNTIFTVMSCIFLLVNMIMFILIFSIVSSVIENPEFSSLSLKVEKIIDRLCAELGCLR